MKKVQSQFLSLILLVIALGFGTSACNKKSSYPCPAYSKDKVINSSMDVDANGKPLDGRNVRKDKNGLVKKKKIKRIHKK